MRFNRGIGPDLASRISPAGSRQPDLAPLRSFLTDTTELAIAALVTHLLL
jgi:hypothetical protein